mgnify:CR=1 FL=1
MNKKLLIIGYSSFVKRRVMKSIKKIKKLDIYICSKSQKINKKVKNVFDNYELALKKQSFDYVYISLINSLHYKYAKMALNYGHNVIVDKPITTSFKQTNDLVKIAEKKKLLLLELTIFNHHLAFQKIITLLGGIKNINLIETNFNVPLIKPIKKINIINGGCNFDMGPYAAAIIRIFFKGKYINKLIVKKNFGKKYKININEFFLMISSKTKTYFGNFAISKEYMSNITFFSKKKIIEIPFQAFALPCNKKIHFNIKEKNKKKTVYIKDDYIKRTFTNILKSKINIKNSIKLIKIDNEIKKKLNLIK